MSAQQRDPTGLNGPGYHRAAQGRWVVLAGAVARLLGFIKPPHEDTVGKRWTLGRLKGKEYRGEVKLSIEGGVALMVAGQNIPLVHVLTLNRRGLKANKDAVFRLVDGDTRQPAAGVGSDARPGAELLMEESYHGPPAWRGSWPSRQRTNTPAHWPFFRDTRHSTPWEWEIAPVKEPRSRNS